MTKYLLLFLLLVFNSHAGTDAVFSKKRVLIVNSYHQGYVWSDNITETIVNYFKSNALGVSIRVIYKDTKRNNGEPFKQTAGLKAKDLIKEWKPDIIIGSDDNAAKYLIQPYSLDSDIPFVFCGLNDDPRIYGFNPGKTTGIREVDLIQHVYEHLKKQARGTRLGYIAADKDVQRTIAKVNEEQLNRRYTDNG